MVILSVLLLLKLVVDLFLVVEEEKFILERGVATLPQLRSFIVSLSLQIKIVPLLLQLNITLVTPLLHVLSHLLKLLLKQLGIVQPALEVDSLGETDQVAAGIRRGRDVLSVIEVAWAKVARRCRTRVGVGEVMVSVVSRCGSAEIGH